MTKLDLRVPPDSHIVTIVREIDAPPKLVYDTLLDPALVPHYWGPAYLETVVDTYEPRPGGSWRFVQKDPDGNQYGFHGVIHDLVDSERIVQTFEFEGVPGHVSLSVLRLEAVDGRTRITDVSVFESVEDRDGMVSSGMESGAEELYDRLEALVLARR
ncbi:MAG: SRPBCC family protein [Candidatus Nanopelagicales bacterium]